MFANKQSWCIMKKSQNSLSESFFIFYVNPMKIILLDDVPKVGRKNEIKEVSDGLAKNMLIPKGLAIFATADAQAKLIKKAKEKTESKNKAHDKIEHNKSELERRTFTVKVKVGDKGQIFSGVHEKDIASAVFQKTKITLDKTGIQAHKAIKELGEHLVTVKLGQGISANIKINVESL